LLVASSISIQAYLFELVRDDLTRLVQDEVLCYMLFANDSFSGWNYT